MWIIVLLAFLFIGCDKDSNTTVYNLNGGYGQEKPDPIDQPDDEDKDKDKTHKHGKP